MLLENFLEAGAARHPGKTALVCGPRRHSYAEIEESANALARALAGMGVRRGDRVCVHLENSAEAVVGLFACLKAGGVFIMVHPEVKEEKLAYILRDSGARVLMAARGPLESARGGLLGCPDLEHVVVADPGSGEDGPEGVPAMIPELHRYSEIAAARGGEPPGKANIDLDLAGLIYTSGSTGQPKGVALTHLNMVSAADSITTYLGNRPDDIILSCLPLAFDYGLYQVLMAFKFGGTVVLEKRFGYPYRVVELIAAERVTGLPLVPTMLALLLGLKDLDGCAFSSLRYVTNTAQALPPHHIARLRALLPHARIFSMFGLTECKRVSYLPPERLDEKPTSVGIAIPNTEVWLEDGEGRRIDEPGVPGELMVRGAHVMVGYWNSPEETAKRLKPGKQAWERVLRTGDLFKRDEEGFLYFISRMDDLIKTGGERVGPKEIENVLYELEGVREAAAVGVPDEVLGQAVKVFLVPREGASLTEAEVMRHCRARMESFMVPRFIEFREDLPKTSSGKISKRGLS